MHDETTIPLPQKRRPPPKKTAFTVEIFLVAMLFVIAVQGTYLGYTVGILTNLERQFGISSKKSGALLSFYDIGHTVAVVLVGFLANGKHLPRITAIGVILSAISMFVLIIPMILFGPQSSGDVSLSRHRQEYILENICDPWRTPNESEQNCKKQRDEHFLAFCILAIGQILAGIAAAPFNTIAYVYVDDNLEDKTKSPFYLGLLSGMYAFAPAFGFALSAGVTRLYKTIVNVPPNLTINSDEWIGAWWLGFIICGLLYLVGAVPLFFFPKKLLRQQHPSDAFEMQHLRNGHNLHDHHDDHQIAALNRDDDQERDETFCEQLKVAAAEFPEMAGELIKNPVFTSMVIGWMFGSYLTGGYSAYLPKYIETQFGRSASAADMYAGIVSIGSVAVSTAFGGYLLTKFNPSPRKALLFLITSWTIVLITYFLGIRAGCDEPQLEQLVSNVHGIRFSDISDCNFECHCGQVYVFNPVNFHEVNYFSPCHAGCREYNNELQKWDLCSCADNGAVENGLYLEECNSIFVYVAIMFTGLFFGNLFFMTTMMVVLRSVYDNEKVLALSFASCITNILGFIPAPIIFGWIIDGSCILWHSRCPLDRGNCVIYDNREFRQNFHLSSAGFQFFAVVSVVICYMLSRKFTFPEEEEALDDEHDERNEQMRGDHSSYSPELQRSSHVIQTTL